VEIKKDTDESICGTNFMVSSGKPASKKVYCTMVMIQGIQYSDPYHQVTDKVQE
jgi:hypothetical protein